MKIIKESWLRQAPLSRLKLRLKKLSRKSSKLLRMCMQLKEYDVLAFDLIEEQIRTEVNERLVSNRIVQMNRQVLGSAESPECWGVFDNYGDWAFRLIAVRTRDSNDYFYATENNRALFVEKIRLLHDRLIDEIGYEYKGDDDPSHKNTGIYGRKTGNP